MQIPKLVNKKYELSADYQGVGMSIRVSEQKFSATERVAASSAVVTRR